jgi:hypothetical protein
MIELRIKEVLLYLSPEFIDTVFKTASLPYLVIPDPMILQETHIQTGSKCPQM